jgi:hypothetical protein
MRRGIAFEVAPTLRLRDGSALEAHNSERHYPASKTAIVNGA